MKLVLAQKKDTEQINTLLNVAYRGKQGWTTEYGILAGDRSCIDDIESLINDKKARFLIYKKAGQLVACVCLEKQASDVSIGSFAVNPSYQSKGLGKMVLAAAEEYAVEKLGAAHFIMVVLSCRTVLIAYYERRGYQRTGIYKEFPVHLKVGIPQVEDVRMEVLKKSAPK